MKNVSESTWTFQMILIFMLIFAAFLALVLTYSKAYTIKNRAVSIIEKYEGATNESIDLINSYAKQKSYVTTSRCPNNDESETWYGVSLDGDIEVANPSERYMYCLKPHKVKNESLSKRDYFYYDVVFFYRFNLPFLGEVGVYPIKGETKQFIGNKMDDRLSII